MEHEPGMYVYSSRGKHGAGRECVGGSTASCVCSPCACFISRKQTKTLVGRTENTPPFMPDPGHASLGVSWAGRLRVRNSHGGLASGRASGARGCPLAGRDRHGDSLHTVLCFWRLLLALCAIAMPEAVLGECVAVLRRQWIEPRRRLHRCAAAAHRPLHACSPASRRKRVFPSVSSSLPEW